MNQKSTLITAAASGLVVLVLIAALLVKFTDLGGERGKRVPEIGDVVPENRPAPTGVEKPKLEPVPENAEGRGMFAFSEAVLQMLLRAMAEGKGAIKNELVLRFDNDEAYRKFLASGGGKGLKILGSSDGLRALRVGFDSYRELSSALGEMDGADIAADANFLVTTPLPPEATDSPGPGEDAVPFGRDALRSLGVTGDNSEFGTGVKVAVLDSGVQDHSVFAATNLREWNMVFDDAGNPMPIDPNNGHGTAVASIIASSDSRLPGVAPGAEILSYRVLDNDGNTDSFTLSEAIVSAVDNGANVINVSLGSSGDSAVVRDAIAYAASAGALVVAAAGNEGGDVSYPAALGGVVGVGAYDARGEHLQFSNSGLELANGGMAAPGYGVTAAWPEEMGVNFSGTSASAPYVSGAVAAIMSENPGVTAYEAYDLLVTHSNEAGAPGSDSLHGTGNLNIGRVLNADTAGISDVAVASYYYDPSQSTGGAAQAQVIIENRGTTPLHNVSVDIGSGAGLQTHTVSYLGVGEISVIDTQLATTVGEIGVSANAKLSGDSNPADNSVQRAIRFE